METGFFYQKNRSDRDDSAGEYPGTGPGEEAGGKYDQGGNLSGGVDIFAASGEVGGKDQRGCGGQQNCSGNLEASGPEVCGNAGNAAKQGEGA